MFTLRVLKHQPAESDRLIGSENLYIHNPTHLYIAPAKTAQTLVKAGGILVVQGDRWMIKVGSDLAACFRKDGSLDEEELRTFRFYQPGPGEIFGRDIKSGGYYGGWYKTGMIACSHEVVLREHFVANEPIEICAVLSRADRGVLLSHKITPGGPTFNWSAAAPAALSTHWSPYVRAVAGAGYPPVDAIVAAGPSTEPQQNVSTYGARFLFPVSHGFGELVSYVKVPLRATLDAAFEYWITNDGDFKAAAEFRQAWSENRTSCFEKYSIPLGLEFCGEGTYGQRRWMDPSVTAAFAMVGPANMAPASAEVYNITDSGAWPEQTIIPKLWTGMNALAGGSPYFERNGLTVFNMCAPPAAGVTLDKIVLQVPFAEHTEKHASALVNILTGRAVQLEDAESISVQQAIVRHAIWPEGEGFPILVKAPDGMNQQQTNTWANEQIVKEESNNDRLNRTSGRASALDVHVTAVVKKTIDRWKQLV